MLEKIKNFIFDPYLDDNALKEVQEIIRLVNAERFKYEQVKQNTALVPHSDKWLERQEGLIKVLEKSKEAIMSQKLQEAGVEVGQAADIDLKTGEIKLSENNES